LSSASEVEFEQQRISMLYGRLDALREQAADRLDNVLLQAGGTPEARTQRESSAALYREKVAMLGAVENGLCFGRLDFDLDHEVRYVGRLGIFDEDGDFEPLLIDWRAPAARPFYLATAASRDGVRRRRHIRTKRRTVTGLDDEVLDLDEARGTRDAAVTGEAALLAAVTASRTGRMRDIVETIQAEQDHVIRSDVHGLLVVQGGPGTGKTAVALHRAAYLLYTHRQLLSSRAVLIVAPNVTFVRYVSQVLPSLAETGVLLCTVGDLFPGVNAHREEPAEVAEIKGRAVMSDVLAAAVLDRQEVPDETVLIPIDGDHVQLTREIVEDARASTRRAGKLHNVARKIFDTEVIHALSWQLADRIGFDPYAEDPLGENDAPGEPQLLEEGDLAEIRRELAESDELIEALDELWPILTPRRLLANLFASEERLATAVANSGAPLTDTERKLLLREPQRRWRTGWTPADVPLLDEAAELLGEDDRPARVQARVRRMEEIEYAEGALEIARGSQSIDAEDEVENEILSVIDLIGAERLADRHEDREQLTAAERAAADRKWAFGHIIVDEAQELSPMAWRLLMRRSPSRSMTIVGDIAQTGILGGAASWQEMLQPYVSHRWRLAQLKVNYRTPAEIMALASGVLHAIDPSLEPPRSVRSSGSEPWTRQVTPDGLCDAVVEHVLKEIGGEDKLVVLVPDELLGPLGRAVSEKVPELVLGEQPELESDAVMLTVRQAKGLEFDSVLVVEPDRIVAESPRGLSDLYVALTRATQRLGIIHSGQLPAALRDRAGS
jgi:DNA helicase IV